MIAPAKAGKFTLYGAERQGLVAERTILVLYTVIVPTLRVGMPQGTLRVPATSPLWSQAPM